MQTNPDYLSREELIQIQESRLRGSLIQDADLARKVSHSGMIIKATRDEMGLTQKELADKSGVHESAIAQFERGTRNPSYETINRLCDALNITSDYLMGRRPKSFDDLLQNDHTIYILRLFIHFDERQRRAALDFIKFLDDQKTQEIAEIEHN